MSLIAILVPAQGRPPCTRTQVLRSAGVRVAEAYSGADVKRLMAIQRPDAVLVEAGITPAASADIWRALDQSPPAAHVVMFGDFRDEAVRTQAREHGALCLAPRSEEDLAAAVQELVNRYRQARQETERIKSELSANVREFQRRIRQTFLLQPSGLSDSVVILVADDEECVRRFLTATLERGGYIVLEAVDGDEAIRALWNYAGTVRLVILDWAMPGVCGVDVVRTMRKVSPESRLLICTGSPEAVVRAGLRGERVEGVLEKPFMALDLLEEVGRQIRDGQPATVSRGPVRSQNG